jgi:hypothetical protein
MYGISFDGPISIITHGKKIGELAVKLYLTDSKGSVDISLDKT